MSDCGVRVICRFRPINKREISEGLDPEAVKKILLFPDPYTVDLQPWNNRSGQLFQFDRVFADPATTQEEVYELAARDSIDNLLKGFNATIFAYGQTGAGKSFTMFGPDISAPKDRGIIPRSCNHIFRHIAEDTEGNEYTIKCSFLEIYKEVVNDLLNPSKKNLKVRETPSRGVWVDGLTEEYVTCEQDVYDLIKLGEKSRAVSSTNMNATSSRSHSLFILKLHQKSTDGSTKEGKLNLADLAGSEKVGKTGASGDTLEEAKKINQSLSALGNCINALTKSGKKAHIPYRDSKLTFILRESLGGNTKTTLLIACSPHIFNLEETIGTLMFGKRAKTIKNKVKVNKQRSVAELMAIIERLKKELAYFKRYTKALEKAIEEVKGPGWRDELDIPQEEAPEAGKGARGDESGGDKLPRPSPSEPVLHDKARDDGAGDAAAGSSDEGTHRRTRSSGGSKAHESASTPALHLLPEGSAPSRRRSGAVSPRADEFNADATEALAELQVRMERMKEQHLVAMDELRDDVSSMQEEKESLSRKAAEAEQLLASVQEELKNASAKLASEGEEMEKMQSKFEYERSEMKLEMEAKQKQLEDQVEDNTRLKEKLALVQQQESTALAACEAAETKQKQLERDLGEQSSAARAAEQLVTSLQAQLGELRETQERLSQEHSELSKKIKKKSQELATAEEQHKEQTASIKDLTAQLRQKSQSEKELQSRLGDAKESIKALQTDLDEVREQLDKAQCMQGELKEEGEKELEELRQQTVSKEAWDQASAQLKQARAEAAEAQEGLKEMKYKVAQLQDNLEENTATHLADIGELQAEHSKRLAELEEEHEEEKAEAAAKEQKLVKKLADAEVRIEALEVSAKEDREEKRRLRDENDAIGQQVKEREHQIGALSDTVHDKQREVSTLEKTVQLQEKSVTNQKQRIEHLEAEYNRVKEEKEQLLMDLETALKANMENAKQFEEQIERAQVKLQSQQTVERQRRASNIKVPVRQAQRSPWQVLFGIKPVRAMGSWDGHRYRVCSPCFPSPSSPSAAPCLLPLVTPCSLPTSIL
eukprot:TRINITY_DN3635_c0_g2_i2.p1 TRINITY_DN3635_c0_g2~~TRINITY_DN3635_c0_g2_i2.p1  ORF type:complete len:1107 (-),score=368.20 TRINITY_DN3635_c0_g2_i2:148-3303(-)